MTAARLRPGAWFATAVFCLLAAPVAAAAGTPADAGATYHAACPSPDPVIALRVIDDDVDVDVDVDADRDSDPDIQPAGLPPRPHIDAPRRVVASVSIGSTALSPARSRGASPRAPPAV
jgi:hypothetical protein